MVNLKAPLKHMYEVAAANLFFFFYLICLTGPVLHLKSILY